MRNKSVKNRKIIGVVCVLAIFATLMCSCISKPDVGEGIKEEVLPDTFVPSNLDGYAQALAEYENYKQKTSNLFSNVTANPESDFEYAEIESGVEIISYIGSGDIVTVPEVIGDKPVTGICEGAFTVKDDEDTQEVEVSLVRSIYVPDSVKSIGKGAFEDCDSLQLLRLPFIGDGGENTHFAYVFGAQTYDSGAISVPVSLETVIIGSLEDAVADHAFFGIKSIYAVVIEGVRTIGKFAFSECDKLVYVSLPDGLESVGNYAFSMCGDMSKIELPDSTLSVGLGAFYLCRSMFEIILPVIGDRQNTHIGYIFGAEAHEWNDDFLPAALKRVVLTEGVKRIEDQAFENCKNIVEVVFPESIQYIGVRAFVNCRSLYSVDTGKAAVTIAGDAFFGCDNLQHLSISGAAKIETQAFFGCVKLNDENKYISPDVTVAEGAFGK